LQKSKHPSDAVLRVMQQLSWLASHILLDNGSSSLQ